MNEWGRSDDSSASVFFLAEMHRRDIGHEMIQVVHCNQGEFQFGLMYGGSEEPYGPYNKKI